MDTAFGRSLLRAGWIWSYDLLEDVVCELNLAGVPDEHALIGMALAQIVCTLGLVSCLRIFMQA